jgi:hypothetical protein
MYARRSCFIIIDYYFRATAGKAVVKIGETVPPTIVAMVIYFGSKNVDRDETPNSMWFEIVMEINCDWMVPICVWIAEIVTSARDTAMRPIPINSG